LQADCSCPVGVLAKIDNRKMKMRAQVFLDESAAPREAEVEGAPDEGGKLAGELLRRITQE
jgi:porphobilinogen deaminase